eukprot:140292_1
MAKLYVAALQYICARNIYELSQWSFYVRPICDHEIKQKEQLLYVDFFELKHRNIAKQSLVHFIINCKHKGMKQNDCDWAMWVRKSLKKHYRESKGGWRILEDETTQNRIPIHHLDIILSLLRNKYLKFQTELTSNEDNNKYKVNVIILNNDNDIISEYKLSFWNGKKIGNASFSLFIVKAMDSEMDKKSKLKQKEQHFMYFESVNENINWYIWGMDDWNPIKEISVLEACYYGLKDDMFPFQRYNIDQKRRLFNYSNRFTVNKKQIMVFIGRTDDDNPENEITSFQEASVGRVSTASWRNYSRSLLRTINDDNDKNNKLTKDGFSNDSKSTVVQQYIKYIIVPLFKQQIVIPDDIVNLCQLYYAFNVIELCL